MKHFLLVLLLSVYCLLPTSSTAQCGSCAGGQCCIDSNGWRSVEPPVRGLPPAATNSQSPIPNPSSHSSAHSSAPIPSPAWRYETPRGHYRSVVRVQTLDRDGRSRSFGSGVALRWGDRVVVLTARHVVQEARKVWVCGRSQYHACTVVRTDPTWDIAALAAGSADDFEPAEIAWAGEGDRPSAGERLESCGFGGDGRLAVNGGRFVGYRTTLTDRAHSDWMVLSGYARQGDSGGPVFNRRGKLVGVLWGCARGEVVATQCGRLHVFLRQAVGEPITRKSSVRKLVAVNLARPTGLNVSIGGRDRAILPLCPRRHEPSQPQPVPQVIVRPDPYTQSIDRKMDVLIEQKQKQEEEAKPKKAGRVGPVVLFLVLGGAVALGFVVYFGSQK